MQATQPSSILDEMNTITNDLTEFLCLKYTHNASQLQKELEGEKEKDWKKKFTNWALIRQALTYKEHPNGYVPEDPERGVTVILPKTDADPEENWTYLKGSAYCPQQMDPVPYDSNWRYDEDVLLKLAYATHHHYFSARTQLVWLDDFYPLLKGHRICKNKSFPKINERDIYYELDIPEEFHGKNKSKRNLPFDPEKDKIELHKFCDRLVAIALTGKNPE